MVAYGRLRRDAASAARRPDDRILQRHKAPRLQFARRNRAAAHAVAERDAPGAVLPALEMLFGSDARADEGNVVACHVAPQVERKQRHEERSEESEDVHESDMGGERGGGRARLPISRCGRAHAAAAF